MTAEPHNAGQPLEDRLQDLRPRLHRYCARMLGSTVDGEDAVQDTMLKVLRSPDGALAAESFDAWVYRIAHNTCLDALRARSRSNVVPLTDDIESEAAPDAQVSSVGFYAFLQLPELQRCAVILKDVLGHSIEEIADIAGCTPAAAKSALQRGRASLQKLANSPDVRLPLMPDDLREKVRAYVRLFQIGDFDSIREMLADDVKVELVQRLKMEGRASSGRYFNRYAEEPKWRYSFGAVDGLPAMLVFDRQGADSKPAHFVLVDWRGDRVASIRDFLFAPYAMEAAEYLLLE